jgi:hypothetical protein
VPRPIVVAALGVLLLVQTSRAQEAPNLGRRLSLVVGPLFIAQRDEQASPVRYGGATPFLQVTYATRTNRRRVELRVGGAIGTLRSALTGTNDLPRQRTWRGWVEFEYARRLRASDSRTRLLLGGLIAARGTLIHHLYGVPGSNDGGYAFFSTTLGPVVAMERMIGAHTTLTARLGIPVLALIGRPYSIFSPLYIGAPSRTGGLRIRVATVDAFQAADFTAAYAAMLRPGAELVFGYHLVVERYRDVQPFRFASQGVSLAVALRLGGAQ